MARKQPASRHGDQRAQPPGIPRREAVRGSRRCEAKEGPPWSLKNKAPELVEQRGGGAFLTKGAWEKR
jgi:hypothetical protein